MRFWIGKVDADQYHHRLRHVASYKVRQGVVIYSKIFILYNRFCFTSLIFLGLPLAVIFLTTGFSDIGNSIQAIEYFFVNPLPIAIGRFLLVSTGIKVLTFTGVCAIIMLFSILFSRVAQTFTASLALCGILYYLSTSSYININSPI